MTVYTRFAPVKVVGYAGAYQHPEIKDVTVHLVRVEYLEDNPDHTQRWYFQELLKADEGWQEIDMEVAAARLITLSPKELKQALKDAI